MVHQAIDQPIPVVGRFHNHARHVLLERRQRVQHITQLILQPLPIHDIVLVVCHDHHVVVGMQIDSRV